MNIIFLSSVILYVFHFRELLYSTLNSQSLIVTFVSVNGGVKLLHRCIHSCLYTCNLLSRTCLSVSLSAHLCSVTSSASRPEPFNCFSTQA
jgi:hypothetical protein